MSRRLPIYLLIDCSGSMMGDPIEAVRSGVNLLVDALNQSPSAFDCAHLSVITFNNEAKEVAPLTPLSDFTIPDFQTCYGTSLGKALEVLEEKVKTDVKKQNATQQGDWLPLVFILTDGKPSDRLAYQEIAQRIRDGQIPELKSANIIACAAGSKADPEALKIVTDNVTILNNLSAEEVAQYFTFASMVAVNSSESGNIQPSTLRDKARQAGLTIPVNNKNE